MSWRFVEACLLARGFPPNVIKWFKMLHNQSFARLTYNGHLSQPIHLQRSCRQGDPVSSYLFILALEHLLNMIRRNREIKGIKVKGEEYKLSAYADDTVCLLDGDINSVRSLFHDLGMYAKFSGLYPNEGKCKAMWIGNCTHAMVQGAENEWNFAFSWVKSMRMLGVIFENNVEGIKNKNYSSMMTKVQNTINLWRFRQLTPMGKVTVIKTLIVPQFTHIFTALPKPSMRAMKRFKRELFVFLWGGKSEKVKRKVVVKDLSDGGLRMIDIDKYITALQSSWVKRQLLSSHPWVSLFKSTITDDNNIWERNSKSLRIFAQSINNPFWKEVILSWAEVANIFPIFDEEHLRMGLWFSDVTTKFSASRLDHWNRKGIVRVNDILDEQGNLLTFENLRSRYNIRGNRLDYLLLLQSIKPAVRQEFQRGALPTPIIHPIISFALSKPKGTGHWYQLLLSSEEQVTKLWENYWNERLTQQSWPKNYCAVSRFSKSTYYAALHYKILTRIGATNLQLYRCGIKVSPLCERCGNCLETIEHKYVTCPEVRLFWMSLQILLRSWDICAELTMSTVIAGHTQNYLADHAIILTKSLLQNPGEVPTIAHFKRRLKMDMDSERCAAIINGNCEHFDKKWLGMHTRL